MPKRRWLCCCVSANKESDITTSTRSLTDEDYLLPGGEWDPSVSVRKSNHSRKKHKELFSSTTSTERDGHLGLYQPPAIVSAQVLPTFEDFKLLRTVGRGAFWKGLNALISCVYLQHSLACLLVRLFLCSLDNHEPLLSMSVCVCV